MANMSLKTTSALCVLVWAVLLAAAQHLSIISAIGLTLISVFITDIAVKVYQNLTNKDLIEDIKGKAVLITGCDSGFGKLLAERLDQLGFKVYACCLQPEGDVAQSLQRAAVSGLKVLKMDVTNDDDVAQATTFVQHDLGNDKLWCVVNNAGIAELSEMELCPISCYQEVLNVNTLGPLRVTKAFLPLIRKARQARIVIVASLAGRFTFPGFTAYSMSKHAAVSLADGLRQEMVKWNISVHTIEPTLYKTAIADSSINIKSTNRSWEATPEEVRKSYGEAYMEDYRNTIIKSANNAKPHEKLHEVVDDMVHAVAAISPKDRYVPSLITQFRARLLKTLPTELLNLILSSGTPTTVPADLIGAAPTPAAEPVVEATPAAEPVVETAPAAEPIATPAAEPVVSVPAAEPVPEATPAAEPKVETAPAPVPEPAAKVEGKKAPEPVKTEVVTQESKVEAAPAPVAEPAAKVEETKALEPVKTEVVTQESKVEEIKAQEPKPVKTVEAPAAPSTEE